MRGPFTDQVLLVRPAGFGFNPETAADNGFVRTHHGDAIAAQALSEFDAMVATLRAADLSPFVWHEPGDPPHPDAVFPNNWLSTHPGGRVHLYPMATASRRAELDPDLVAELRRCFRVRAVVDWSERATHGDYLEGTGSLVLDARRQLAYASVSTRTDPALVHDWARHHGYIPVLFTAHDAAGRPVYHTNVLLCIGHGFAACGLALVDPATRQALRTTLLAGGELIDLDPAQIDSFAGNMLQLVDRRGVPVLVLSTTALASLRPDQRRVLEHHTTLLPVAIPTIEAVGGGSARCMLAELFLDPA